MSKSYQGKRERKHTLQILREVRPVNLVKRVGLGVVIPVGRERFGKSDETIFRKVATRFTKCNHLSLSTAKLECVFEAS